MKNLAKLLQAILFIFAVAAILLLSDLSNRRKTSFSVKEKYSVAIVHWIDAPVIEGVEAGIFKALSDKGLVQDKNLSVDIYKASGDISMLNSIMKQVQNQSYDLVFVSCTPALQVAVKTITKIPVVFTAVADPVLAGAGTDAAHHLKNVTGCSVVCDFETMCRLISENAPKIKTLGSVYCPGEIISVKFKEEFAKVASKYGLTVKFFPANNTTELPDAVLSMTTSKIDAVCQMADNLMSSGISTLIKGVVKSGLPYFDFNAHPSGSPMESLIQLDVDYYQNGYDAAILASEILLEKKSPGEIPFISPSKVVIEINPEKAKTFGIKFNAETVKQASKIAGEKEPFNPPVKIAMVHYVSSPDCDDVTAGILEQLKELGHVRNGDFTFDEYNANGDVATLNDIVKVVAGKKYNLIFSTVLATTQALSAKIDDVPILFTVVADPVANGLGISYFDHKANVTGIDGMSYTDKGVALLLKYMPEAKSIGTLFCPGEMASVSSVKELEKSCRNYKISLVTVPVNSVSDVADATTLLCMKKIDAISQLPDNCTIPGFSSMVKVTRKHKMPLFCYISSQVKAGAIAAIAGDYLQQGKEIAAIAVRVINGESPASIPFTRIRQIKTVINPNAAKTYGLQTPDDLVKTADKVFYEKSSEKK